MPWGRIRLDESDASQTAIVNMTMTPLAYRWAHAVNSHELLEDVRRQIYEASTRQFRDADYVNAIEADIIWSEAQQKPVMGHPPQVDGELTLEAFLEEMTTLSELLGRFPDVGETPLIVKLDFKSSQAFEAAYGLLRGFVQAFPFPRGVFVNADILVGPATKKEIHFDATKFLREAAALGSVDGPNEHKIVLSVGWTTSNSTDEEIRRPYTDAMVDEMLTALNPYKHLQVTFPLRATSCQSSWGAIKKLLTTQENYGFTLWWAKTQLTDAEIEWLFHTLEETNGDDGSSMPFADRTFYDIKGFEEFLQRRKPHTQ